jgi:N-methylhydantoinase B
MVASGGSRKRDESVNIELQVLGHALRAVADEMGAALIRAAFSANIKERRDCSTALFDERGRMIAQAEHIPVHLGAMPDAVAAVIARDPAPTDIFVLNDPFAGGTHLPDITLVSRTEVGFAVTRAHHADVGGVEPGSMPAFSRMLDEEGVVIPPTRIEPGTLDRLAAQMRNPDERLGDFRAQLGAHRLAEERVAELCARHGPDRIRAAMSELLAYSERVVRAGIARLPDGRYEASDVLETAEGELELHATVTVDGDEVEVDFAGTAPQHEGNLNCPLSVTRSATYFVVRCLTEPEVPASAGAFAPVRIAAPTGSLVNARPGAAVAGGNVETSCRVVDVLFRAFGRAVAVPAQGQGTMNNVTLANERFTYYETLGGGQGACSDADGPSGVHVTMSNTLTTPVEALELTYPLRVQRHELRLGSGGAGRHRGGDGVVRVLEALEACRLSILSERRKQVPTGSAGGQSGTPGRNLLNGRELPAKTTLDLSPGDVLRIETPGGGGFGTV